MNAPQADIVVTTIFQPAWLTSYLHDLRANGRADSVTIRIICDRKTPATVYAAARDARQAGFRIDCPTLDEQVEFLKSIRADDAFVPWNTDNRRNIGFLRAWAAGADVLVSIDDDNHCRPGGDFVGSHRTVGQPAARAAGQMAHGHPWFNICSLLRHDAAGTIYARGFPYAARKQSVTAGLSPLDAATGRRRVAVNAGLWLDDPDVDALTRIAIGPRVRGAAAGAVILAPETWSPINTQNTALIRDAIPAYYYVRMGYALTGLRIDRFGDILSGYFVQKCAKTVGDVIRIGDPVADHRRTPHDLFKDLYHELAGMVLIEALLPWLQELRLTATGYAGACAELAEALDREAHRFTGFVWDEGGREFLKETAACMRHWLGLLRTIDGQGAQC